MGDLTFPPLPTPPPAPVRPPTVAPLEARRGTAARLDSITGKVHRIQGLFTVTLTGDGGGEATHDVNFPVWFIEHPHFTFGFEMAADQVLTAGKYPTLSLGVLRWAMKPYPAGVSYYIGATLVVVVGGVDKQVQLVHWQVEGKALRNPTGETTTADGTI
jgi:hypothetical protein